MNLQEAEAIAQKLSICFKRRCYIDPDFRHRGQSTIAIITNATDIEVGWCCQVVDCFFLPSNTRSTPMGRAFFRAPAKPASGLLPSEGKK